MQFIYADPGLRNNVGHHANIDRALISELRRRGIPLRVLAFGDVEPGLRAELGAEPFFRWFLYFLSDGNPVSGWLNAFERGAAVTAADLGRLNEVGGDDLLYIPFALPAQLKAIALWLAMRPSGQLPRIAIGFTFAPGLDPQVNPNGTTWNARDSRVDPSAVLFSHAASLLSQEQKNRMRAVFPDGQGAALHGALLGLPSATLPHYQQRTTSARNRAGARPITISVLGHQRGTDKGYHLVPQLAAGLLQSHPGSRLLVHNAKSSDWPAAQDAVRAIAKTDPRIIVDENAHDGPAWTALQDRTDLLLLPYAPGPYHLMPSGLHGEAVANGIPSVVPAGTALARIQAEFCGGGTTFAEWTVPSILEATRRALDNFDALATAAYAGAEKWQQTQGPVKIIDDLIAYWRS